MKKRILWLILFAFLLLGCSPMDKSTLAASVVVPTPLFTITPYPSNTLTPYPSFVVSLRPTALLQTPTPAFDATSMIPPETWAKIATLDAISTERPELTYDKICLLMPTVDGCSVLSPNGQWAVFRGHQKGSGGLSIINMLNKKRWDISYYDITGNSWDDTAVDVEHWSRDGRYLYVSPRPVGDGGEGWFWRDYIQLVRLNLDNGTWIDTKMGSAHSFSPKDRYIVFRRGQNVVIFEFQTGNEYIFKVPEEYTAFGRFTWSSDSKYIIFVSTEVDELLSDTLSKEPSGFTLYLLDVDNREMTTIIEKNEMYLYPVEWLTPDIVLLKSLYKKQPDGALEPNSEQYTIDLQTIAISKYEHP
jgi:Tol biopolymer transport system component